MQSAENYRLTDRIVLQGSALDLVVSDDKLYVIDNSGILYLFDAKATDFSKRVDLDFKQPLNAHSKAATLGLPPVVAVPRGKHFLSVRSVRKDYAKYVVGDWHTSPITYSRFSPQGNFLFINSEDGRASLYDHPNGAFRTLFPHRPDYISAAAFNHDETLLVMGYYDRKAVVYSLEREEIVTEFDVPDVVKTFTFTDRDRKLFIAMRSGICLYDFADGDITEGEMAFDYWPTCAVELDDAAYVLLGFRNEEMYAFETRTMEQRFAVTFPSKGVSTMKIYHDVLYVAYFDGKVDFIDLGYRRERMAMELEAHHWRELNALMKENCFLMLERSVIEAKAREWKRIAPELTELCGKGEVDEATHRAQPFLDNTARRREFDRIVGHHKEIRAFSLACNRGHYKNAYELAALHPWLKELYLYEQVEKAWTDAFIQARKLLGSDPMNNVERARRLLRPFAGVKAKQLQMHDLLGNPRLFTDAERCIKRQDFKGYFDLVEAHPVLQELEQYRKVEILGEALLKKLETLDREGEYDTVLKEAAKLADFRSIAGRLDERVHIVEAKQRFLSLLQASHHGEAVRIAEATPEVRELEAYRVLHAEMASHLDEAYRHAYAGEPAATRGSLQKYAQMGLQGNKVREVMKLAYINEIRRAVREEKAMEWGATVETYVALFGPDTAIAHLAAGKTAVPKEAEPGVQRLGVDAYPDSIVR